MNAPSHFEVAATAARYASARPPVHPELVRRAAASARWPSVIDLALDVGCGAGTSTGPLLGRARRVLGVDASVPMVRAAAAAVPDATFAVGRAERLPVGDGTVALITAAGALDGADVDAFSTEARRALAPDGVVVVYDFGRGRRSPTAPGLDGWYEEFLTRCGRRPRPSDLRHRLGELPGLRLVEHLDVVVPMPLTRAAYVAYVRTDAADPDDDDDLGAWCDRTLEPVLGDGAVVAFDAYVAVLVAR